MAEKEGVVKKGHEEGMEMAIALIQEFGLPLGLLPLVDVIKVGFITNTGSTVDHAKEEGRTYLQDDQQIGQLRAYDTQITGFFDKKRIKKLKGVKAKELVLWPPVNEMIVDDPPTGKIHFKSLAKLRWVFGSN